MIVMLHVPKTGGTAVKYALINQPVGGFTVSNAHRETLAMLIRKQHSAVIVLRDPLDRFCSGFYERKHFLERHKHIQAEQDFPPNFGVNFNRAQYKQEEQRILDAVSTADEFITHIRNHPEHYEDLDESDYNSVKTPLGMLTRPLTFWTGSMNYFKNNEQHIKHTVDLDGLEQYLQAEYKLKLPGYDQPLFRRNKSFYGIDSVSISESNRNWFVNEFRREDYAVIEYMRSQTYHWKP